MSSFSAKRKARKIAVHNDDEEEEKDAPTTASLNPPPEAQEPALQASFKSRKPFKKSGLRKSINVDDLEPTTATNEQGAGDTGVETTKRGNDQDGKPTSPPRIRPSIGRTASTKSKKRQSSSRLSFGPSVEPGGEEDDDSIVLGEETFTPIKNRLATASTPNKLPSRLPMRSMDSFDDDRPRYSKEYLSELQSSTPNTPQNIATLHPTDDDEMNLDASELEGAMIVDNPTTSSAPTDTDTAVLTEAEIRVKKERRARLAKQGGQASDDFISLDDGDGAGADQRGTGDSFLTVLSRQNTSHKPKSDTRLVAEDEDLGEGFDSLVEDGGLALGRKAEREARRRRRAEMANLITTAEGDSDGSSSDSEAERRAAYEAAQTRAGMDGLAAEREAQRRRLGGLGVVQIPPKITPLPDLSVAVDAFAARLRRKEAEVARARARLAELRAERDGVRRREPEVQRLLDQAGERYRALMMPDAATTTATADGGSAPDPRGDDDNAAAAAAARSLLDQARAGAAGPGERGLESLGTTPVKQSHVEL
ncbi:nineteen complex-related protein 2-domain-containing protein [Xylariomycetidae sp. FL0641]|nr:nineteen complex-related protein 2-domain-containing protein [Xylariomycetidae sp. FL0641]